MREGAVLSIFTKIKLEVLALYCLVVEVVGVALFLFGVYNHWSGFWECLRVYLVFCYISDFSEILLSVGKVACWASRTTQI